jgi:hypothetical protein
VLVSKGKDTAEADWPSTRLQQETKIPAAIAAAEILNLTVTPKTFKFAEPFGD